MLLGRRKRRISLLARHQGPLELQRFGQVHG
jgi:hypothetical protein